jgi:hypothetical protein
MAEELGWSVEKVQLYAYQYMAALFATDPTFATNRTVGNTTRAARSNSRQPRDEQDNNSNGGAITRPWSLEESILFDTSVARYMMTTNGSGVSHGAWEQLVADEMPGRTSNEVQQRYRQLYSKPKRRPTPQNNNPNR